MRILIVSVLLVLGLSACATRPENRDVAADRMTQMSWLTGIWQRTGLPEGQSATETWKVDAHGLVGRGVLRREGKIAFEERLRIQALDGTIVYIADVAHNPAPVAFALSKMLEDGFVFENLAHDYPQRIAYRYKDGRMSVAISAGDGGRAQVFYFKRAPVHRARIHVLPETDD